MNWKGVPFQFSQKFHSRRSENNIKRIQKNARKEFLQYHCFLILNISTTFEKQALKMPDFSTNQNFAFTTASSVEGLYMANKIFLSF